MVNELRWEPELVRRFWDEQSGRPEEYFSERYGGNIVAHLRTFFAPGKILDYGCGAGGLLGHLLTTREQVFGADISEDSLATVRTRFVAKKNFGGASLPSELVKRNERFSTIVLSEVVEHLEDATLREVFQEIVALAGPAGVVIVTTPNGEDLSASQVYCPSCDSKFHRWQHVRSWSAQTLARFMEEAGLQIVAIKETNFSDAPGLKANLKRIILTLMKRNSRPHLAVIGRIK